MHESLKIKGDYMYGIQVRKCSGLVFQCFPDTQSLPIFPRFPYHAVLGVNPPNILTIGKPRQL